MRKGEWIELFRAGDYGEKGKYTNDDIATMAKNFNVNDEIPIVAGHPEINHPRWGGIDRVVAAGDVILGRVGHLHAKMETAIKERLFNNRSVRIGQTEAGPQIRHLGMLGAALPAVAGLSPLGEFASDIKFNDFTTEIEPEIKEETPQTETEGGEKNNGSPIEDGGNINTKEGNSMTDVEIAALKQEAEEHKVRAATAEAQAAAAMAEAAQLKAQHQADMAASLRKGYEEQVKDFKGAITEADQQAIVEFCMSMHTETATDFSYEDGSGRKSVPPAKFFLDFVAKLNETIKKLKKDKPHMQRIGADFAVDDEGPGKVNRSSLAAKM